MAKAIQGEGAATESTFMEKDLEKFTSRVGIRTILKNVKMHRHMPLSE